MDTERSTRVPFQKKIQNTKKYVTHAYRYLQNMLKYNYCFSIHLYFHDNRKSLWIQNVTNILWYCTYFSINIIVLMYSHQICFYNRTLLIYIYIMNINIIYIGVSIGTYLQVRCHTDNIISTTNDNIPT